MSTARHRGQSNGDGGRQHDQPQPAEQYQNRSFPGAARTATDRLRHCGQVRDHCTRGRRARDGNNFMRRPSWLSYPAARPPAATGAARRASATRCVAGARPVSPGARG